MAIDTRNIVYRKSKSLTVVTKGMKRDSYFLVENSKRETTEKTRATKGSILQTTLCSIENKLNIIRSASALESLFGHFHNKNQE